MNSGKVKCTCGWSWNKSDSSKKDMYICHECGRDNSNNMKNGGALDKAQTGKKLPKETEADRAKRVAEKTAGALGIGLVLDQYPGAETVYDGWNIIDAYNEGDPMKIMPNVFGALLPGISGKAIEAVTEEYLPKTPEKEKEKFKAVMKGKRASFEEMRKAQESIDWSKGWDKMKSDIKSLFIEPPTIDKQKVIKYFNSKPKNRLENGGWLDNYNDSKTTAPEGFQGDGYSNVGRNYSPAWGGQFQKGGKLKFLQPTDPKLPIGGFPKLNLSSEKAISIGGENGEPAYLIPSFKYGQPLNDPMGEFRKTGEHLGGPFKTWQEADEWERTVRHPAVEKGENIMFPQQEFRKGGNIPKAQEGINNIFGNMMGGKNTSQYEMYGDDYARNLNEFNPHYTRIDKKEPAPTTELPSKDKLEIFTNNVPQNIGFTPKYPAPATSSNRQLPVGPSPVYRKRRQHIYDIGDIYNIKPEYVELEEEEEEDEEPTDPISWIIEKITDLFTPSDKTESETDTEGEGGEKGSWNIQQKNTRMKGGGGSYDALNINTNNPKTIREAKRKADIFNSSIQKKYGKSKNPKAIERLNTIRNDVQITPNIPTPNLAMGGSIPGAVGFTYARTKGIPSNGPHAKKTLASAQNGVDMYENPMLARRVDNPNVNRSYYDPRLNTMNIGTDYNTWKDEYTGELLTGDDLKYHQDKLLAHENYHAIQHSQDRDNYDIAHNTDNAQWAQMQKRPEVMSTHAVWNNFYNRSDFENQQDYQEMINSYPESRILNQNLLFDKVLDRQRYDNPANLEGEAKFYEDTGVDISKQQSELSLNPTRFQNGGEMSYYQHGLDWKPKGMENGGWLNKYQEGGTLSDPPKSHYKRLYGHANDAGVGESEKMKIDPNTGYSYFPQETSLSQEKEVPNSPWNVSRFLFDPFIRNVSQGIHNAKYDKEGKIIDSPDQRYFTTGLNRREKYNSAKKDITSYYKEDLKLNDADVEKKVDDTMDLVRKMRRAEEMMERHNTTFKDFENPEEVFKSAVGFNKLYPQESVIGDKNLSPAQAKRAYKMFQKTWRGTSGKEARQNSREELKKAKEALKVSKEKIKEGLIQSDSKHKNSNPHYYNFENGGIIKAQEGYQTGDKPILGGGKYHTTTGKVVDWGTPEYEAAYNRGEVLSDDGVPSEVTLQGGVLPELVLQNNYKRGFWEKYRDKIIDENRDAGPLGAAVGAPISAVTSLPQLAATYGITGEMQRPSEAMDIENPYLAMGTDFVLDPLNAIGTGVLTKEQALARLAASKENVVGKIINKSITPIGYDPFTVAAAPLELLTPKALKFKPQTYATKNRFDSWKLYNGLKPEFNTFSKNADGTLAINDFRLEKSKLQAITDNPKKSFGTMEIEPEFNFAGVHGNGWITKGVDEQGRKFIDFTDTWDLQPLKGVKGLPKKVKEFEVSSLTGGKPFDLKNRIYYDDTGNFFDHTGNKLVEEMQHFPKGVVDQNKAVDLPMLSTKNVVGTKQMDVLSDWNKAVNQKFQKGIGTLAGGVGTGIGYLTYKERQKHKKQNTPPVVSQIEQKREGGVIKDDLGQWAHPGEITEIGSNNITMQGVPYDVLGISDEGDIKLMKPGKNYKFKGKKVTEFPMAKNGVNQQDEKTLQHLDQLTNFTNYNKPQPGGWLNKYN